MSISYSRYRIRDAECRRRQDARRPAPAPGSPGPEQRRSAIHEGTRRHRQPGQEPLELLAPPGPPAATAAPRLPPQQRRTPRMRRPGPAPPPTAAEPRQRHTDSAGSGKGTHALRHEGVAHPASGMKASAAHNAGRHDRDSSLPSGKTSSRTRREADQAPKHRYSPTASWSRTAANQASGPTCTARTQKTILPIAVVRPIRHSSGPIG